MNKQTKNKSRTHLLLIFSSLFFFTFSLFSLMSCGDAETGPIGPAGADGATVPVFLQGTWSGATYSAVFTNSTVTLNNSGTKQVLTYLSFVTAANTHATGKETYPGGYKMTGFCIDSTSSSDIGNILTLHLFFNGNKTAFATSTTDTSAPGTAPYTKQ
jgi:hypothetical protein